MDEFLSLSPTPQIEETGAHTQSYFAGAIQSRLLKRDVTKERAQRLYAIGELNAAAQMLSELAARRHPYQVAGRGNQRLTASRVWAIWSISYWTTSGCVGSTGSLRTLRLLE
jgi:hypothetical protein